MNNILLIFLAAMLCSLSNCNKDNKDDDTGKPPTQQEEQLPPITTTGAETFGCKVNGKVWIAKSNKTNWPSTYASINRNDNSRVNISGSILYNETKYELINVTFYKNDNSSYYPLYLDIKKPHVSAAKYTDVVTNKFWGTDSLTGGGTTISRFDTIHQIISGTFSFKCISKETQDMLDITEGRFDGHYTY